MHRCHWVLQTLYPLVRTCSDGGFSMCLSVSIYFRRQMDEQDKCNNLYDFAGMVLAAAALSAVTAEKAVQDSMDDVNE